MIAETDGAGLDDGRMLFDISHAPSLSFLRQQAKRLCACRLFVECDVQVSRRILRVAGIVLETDKCPLTKGHEEHSSPTKC
jgi:hypothetical protein